MIRASAVIVLTSRLSTVDSYMIVRQVAGLGNSSWSSFQSYNFPDRYIRHSNYVLRIDPISNDAGRADATFRRTS